jgi:hypothetical protein
MRAAFNHSGTFNVQSGTLSVNCGGTSTGPMKVASGAAINFGAGAGYRLIAPGAINISYAGNPDPVGSVRLSLANHGVVAGGDLALAYVDSADGVAGVPPSTIVVKPALPGDVNLDGIVSFADLLTLAQHYGKSDALYDQGDLNADGTVGFGDLLILAQHYGQRLAGAGGAAATSHVSARTNVFPATQSPSALPDESLSTLRKHRPLRIR